MAFLDNSGDIILDAVLTDTGRFRLAKGDGSFKIVKFALADDEINYALYNKMHASGTAYYDLEIMQTPVMEAFTNNASLMNHKLLSIPRTNLLYLPTMRFSNNSETNSPINAVNNGFAIAVTRQTWETGWAGTQVDGVMNGEVPAQTPQIVRIDQGLDTNEVSWQFQIDKDLKETQYIVEIDNRLGTIATPEGNYGSADISFIDDDNIASYYFSLGTDDAYIQDILSDPISGQWDWSQKDPPSGASIRGPQGTCLKFKILSSLELISSDFLFNQLGNDLAQGDEATWSLADKNYKYIDTIVKVMGATTGYRIDIPVRFIKCTNC